MDPAVKVTGFSFRRSVVYEIKELFGTVAQVNWVQLASDRNSATVYFYFKSALAYVLEHEWRLGNECLKLHVEAGSGNQHPRSLSTSLPPQCHTHHEAASVPPLTARKNKYSLADYVEHSQPLSQYAFDQFPHLPPQRKRRRRNSSLHVSTTASSCIQKKRHTKKRKKKKGDGYLEMAASLPFGIIPIVQEPRKATPSKTVEMTEVFLMGSGTKLALVPMSATVTDIKQIVSERVGVPSHLLNITIGGRALNDDVAISPGCNFHYSVKGFGGADSENQGGNSASGDSEQTAKSQKKKEEEEIRNDEQFRAFCQTK